VNDCKTASAIVRALMTLVPLGKRAGLVALKVALDSYTTVELAAAAYDWELWQRPDQVFPKSEWRSISLVTSRGWGKTTCNVSFLIQEVIAGRAQRIALVGQSELKTIEVLVTGATGILALCPPWLGAEWESSSNIVRFGNGAIATVYTAAEPSGLRGPQHDLAIATEIASWPTSTAVEAMSNLQLGLRLGQGRLLVDGTPRRRNALVRERLALAAKDPKRHILIRGRVEDNALHLSPGIVQEWREQFSDRTAAEELDGHYYDDSADAVFKQNWIDAARRKMPDRVVRRVISIDPSITESKRADHTGVVECCLGVDSQILVTANMSGKHPAHVWPEMVVSRYLSHGASLVLCEENRGGSFVRLAVAGACQARGLSLIELGPGDAPEGRPGVVYYRGYNSKGSKVTRASVAAALVERGKVSFVGDLGDLETRLCDFDGSEGAIDDSVDAFVAGVVELSGLAGGTKVPFNAAGFNAAAAAIGQANPAATMMQKSVARSFAQSGSFRGMPENARNPFSFGGNGGGRI